MLVWSSLFWFKFSSDKKTPHRAIKKSKLGWLYNHTDDVIGDQAFNESQSTNSYTSIWRHQSRKTLQSFCRTLWPQTTENTKSVGILLGVQPGYDNGQQTNMRRCGNKWVKKDYHYLGAGQQRTESKPSYTLKKN